VSIGGSKLQPLYSACCAPFCEHKARFRPQPRPVSTRLDSCTSLTLQAAGLRKEASSFPREQLPDRCRRAQGSKVPKAGLVEGGHPHAMPGAGRSSPQAVASHRERSFTPSGPARPKPRRSGDQATHGRFGSASTARQGFDYVAVEASLTCAALSAPDATGHEVQPDRIANPAKQSHALVAE
jgi:hypothetical protein